MTEITLSRELFAKVCPAALPQYVEAFTSAAALDALKAAGIFDSARRLQYFMANVCEETGGLTIIRESMTYTTAARIAAVWPSRFSVSSAARFVRQPELLAEQVYNGRMGDKTGSKDGYLFRGGGPLQATGRDFYAYLQSKSHLCFLDVPTTIEQPQAWLPAAVITWTDHPSAGNLNLIADKGNFKGCCNGINRGNPFSSLDPIGWADRQEWLQKWTAALGVIEQVADTLLSEGMPESSEVEDCQERLQALGYYDRKPDSIFGARTTRAVLAFQNRNALDTDGKIGAATFKKLFAADAIAFPPTNAALEGIAALRDAGHPDIVSADRMKFAGHMITIVSSYLGLSSTGLLGWLGDLSEQMRGMGNAADEVVDITKKVIAASEYSSVHVFWVVGILAAGCFYWAYKTKIDGLKNDRS